MGNVHGKKKEVNVTSQITVNSYDNYNAPVDNRNIAYLKMPNGGTYKCFQMTPGIWVTPQTKQKIAAQDIGSYNQYLKYMSFYFKRISLFDTGKHFFQVISQSSPYKYYKEFYNRDKTGKQLFKNKVATVFMMDKDDQTKRVGVVNLSVLVITTESSISKNFPVNNLKRDKDNHLLRQSYGDISVVTFNPQYISKVFLIDGSSFFFDPMIALFHELIHAFHVMYAYYFKTESVPVNKRLYSLEELITHGGQKDLNAAKNNIRAINTKYLNNIRDLVGNLNQSKKSEQFKDFYARKYFLTKTQGKYVLTNDGALRLTDLVQKTFTERAILMDSGVLGRSNYYDVKKHELYIFDPFDTTLYNLHNGPNNQNFDQYIKTNKVQPLIVEESPE